MPMDIYKYLSVYYIYIYIYIYIQLKKLQDVPINVTFNSTTTYMIDMVDTCLENFWRCPNQ